MVEGAHEPNFYTFHNKSTEKTTTNWIAVVAPGASQTYWTSENLLVQTLYNWGVQTVHSLDLKLRHNRTVDEAVDEISNELLTLLPAHAAPYRVVFTGYCLGGMILVKVVYKLMDSLKTLLHPDSLMISFANSFKYTNPRIESFILALFHENVIRSDEKVFISLIILIFILFLFFKILFFYF